jgi:signal peptidase II
MKQGETGLVYLWVSVIIVILDQISKYIIGTLIDVNTVGYKITPFFSLVHVWNEGAAFSLLADSGGWQQVFFITVAIVISIILTIFLKKSPRAHKWNNFAIALVIGGAVGNLIDRVFFEHVVDFLLFYVRTETFSYYYPAFNVADICVCVGAALLILISFFKKDEEHADEEK